MREDEIEELIEKEIEQLIDVYVMSQVNKSSSEENRGSDIELIVSLVKRFPKNS
jgi:hypothetical protein